MTSDKDTNLVTPKKGLKINNKDSSVQPAKPDNKELFEKQADEVFSKYQETKQKTWDLSAKFKLFIEDKVLPENKTILTKELEKEVLNKLAELGSEIDSDENQPVGGGVILCRLLMGFMLVQRDIINTLAYKVEKLEKKNDIILSTVQKLDVDIQKIGNNK